MLKEVKILWTGGWDSTFRIMCLSEMEVVIQPFYLLDNRVCEQLELNTIDKITNELTKRSSVKCIMKPLITQKVEDVESDESITIAFNHILQNDYIGSQYDWLARFAKTNQGLELCIHQDDKACNVIKKLGLLKESVNESGKYYIVDSQSPAEIYKVFGNFHFPILDISKIEMKKKAEECGFIDIMNMTWFCHTPINNAPCGICNPCCYTIEEGLDYRFSPKALMRNKYKMSVVSG